MQLSTEAAKILLVGTFGDFFQINFFISLILGRSTSFLFQGLLAAPLQVAFFGSLAIVPVTYEPAENADHTGHSTCL